MSEVNEQNQPCISCETIINVDEGDYCTYFTNGKVINLCYGCDEDQLNSASNVYLVEDGEVKHFYVTDYFSCDALYREQVEDLFERSWVSNYGRGHYDTTIQGFQEIKDLTGWTTAWVDETVSRKTTFNDWAGEVISGDIVPPVTLAIVLDPTSNVFSTGVSVWVKDGDIDEFAKWILAEREELAEAVR
jgi:hypothetical protein